MKKKLSNRGKKILAVVLALVVACSVLPNTSLFGDRSVFAAGEDEGETKEAATELTEDITDYTLRITGSENNCLPTVGVISADNQTLVLDEDYTFSFYSDSDEAAAIEDGTYYTLTVSGAGLYTGEITKQYYQEDASADNSATFYILTPGTDVALFGSWYNGEVTASLRNSEPGSGYFLYDSADGYADISADASAASAVTCDAEGSNYFYLTNDSGKRDQIYCYRVLVDSAAPMLSAGLDVKGEWTQSKTIEITASDSMSGLYEGYVYYAAGTNVLSIDSSGKVTETQITDAQNDGTLTAVTVSEDGSAEIYITDALDETGTTYYIYAIDNAGNVTAASVDVSKIDTSAPEITVDTDYAGEDGGFQDTYWRSGDALTISFAVTDDTVSDESLLGSVTVQKLSDGSYNDCDSSVTSVAWNSTDQKYVLTLNTEGSYRIVVTDKAGNSYTSGAFEVKQDSSAPTVSVDAENDAGYTVTDADGNYCFANSLTVTLTVTDEAGESDTAQSDVTVSVTVGSTTTEYEYALQTLLTDAGVFTSVTDNEDGTYTLLYEMTESGSVSFSVADEINAAAEISVSAKNYEDEPSVELDYASGSEPTQVTESGATIDYFNSESIEDLDILANITDGSGIVSIAYEITTGTDESFDGSGSETYGISVYGQEDYTSFTDQSLAVLTGDDDILTGLDDGSYTVTYTVTNVLGNTATASISISVDTAAPDGDIYVACTSDSDVTDASDYYSSGLGGTVRRLINTLTERIFGKTNVYFTFYLKDADGDVVSGIDADTLIADGNITLDSDVDSGVTLTVNEDSVTTAEVDLTVDDAEMSGTYTMIRGVISTTSEDELDSLNHILIQKVDDMAGNSLTEIDGAAILGTESVILDNVHPDVSVSYPAYNESDGDNYYYSPDSDDQSYEEIVLTYTEKYFEENLDDDDEMILPFIQVSTDGGENYTEVSGTESEAKDAPYVKWDETDVSDGTLTATLYLPYSTGTDGGEIEYLIQTSYTDGSGNVLTRVTDDGMSSIDEDIGLYQSETLVLDNEVPMLVYYEISGTTLYQVDGVDVYQNDEMDDDVTLDWVINDNDEYWDASRVTLTIRNKITGNNSVEISGDDASIEWDSDGQRDERQHTAVYTFDGDTDPANYEVVISYTDYAQNAMVSGDENLIVTDGTYTGEEFILDHTAPIFNISYTKAYRLVKDSDTAQSNDVKDTVPTTGYTAYYSTDIDVTIEITEDYAAVQNATGTDGTQSIIGLTDYTIQVNGVLADSYMPQYTWTYDESTKTYTMRFTLSAEDYYRLSVSYTDAAGNVMSKGSTVQGSYTSLNSTDLNGSYGSTLLVIDKTAPRITGSYSSTVIDETSGRYYFNRSTNLTLTVTDSNIRNQELKDAMSEDRVYMIENAGTNIFDSTSAASSLNALNGSTIYTRQGETEYTLSLSTQANYNLLITGYEDLAGNTAVISDYNPYVCVDTAGPTNVTFTYSVDSVGTWEAINYAKLGYVFANSKLTVKVAAKDATAGLKQFTFYVTDENGTVTTIVRTVDPAASASESIMVPLSENDFKGSVEVAVTDWSGNINSKTEGQIVQSASRHASAGSATITTLTDPSRTVNGVDYYNTDVTFNLTMKETYAGLRSCSYTAGSLICESFDYSAQAGYDLTQNKSYEITDTFSANLTLAASANNQNDVSVEASYIDNTGYAGSVSKTYNIDITKPIIEVTYDNNSPTNETYYKDTRTATVVITERNFDADDVVFTITNTDGTMPAISGWTTSGSGDTTKHTAAVTFGADGDYTFTVAFQDLAGNKADYSTVDEFTIDKTIPTYTITYDNNSSQNGYYYDANRAATIDILEHNFDASAVTITVTRDGSDISPVISGWTRNGDHNIATVSFNADGDYTFTISGMDLAANPMDEYTMDHFVVDTEVPEIEIYNIENFSANNGVVQPGIRYSDTNYDSDAVVVEMTGYNNGTVSMDGRKTITSKGVEILMDDFEYVQEMDDMYTMTATVYDLAGNSSEASVTFSVNRFGSVYTFDAATNALVGEDGSYCTNEEPMIVVYETNVDTLESGEIAKNLNGDLNTLEENEDYTVKVSGDEASWKQYIYTLDSSNFETEGEYILTFMSRDRATNYNTNETQIGFVLDKTAPTVLISGITDGEQLREETHNIVISAEDNVRLDYVTIINDGESAEYDSEDVTDGSFTHILSSKDEQQTLQVIATDAAGNQSSVMSIVDESGNVMEELEELTYLLTTNLWIQFISNTPLLIGVIAVIAAVIVLLLWWFLLGKKRRKKDEESVQASS